MPTNGNDPAQPTLEHNYSEGVLIWETQKGMTIREAMSMAAMQGIVANSQMIDTESWEWLGNASVKAADALIKALNQ